MNKEQSCMRTSVLCIEWKLAGFTSLKNMNICMRTRLGVGLSWNNVGICNMNLISLQHGNDKRLTSISKPFYLEEPNERFKMSVEPCRALVDIFA